VDQVISEQNGAQIETWRLDHPRYEGEKTVTTEPATALTLETLAARLGELEKAHAAQAHELAQVKETKAALVSPWALVDRAAVTSWPQVMAPAF
jgi:hypothetical protein